MLNFLSALWCNLTHRDETCWPIRGTYECRRCGRKVATAWDLPPLPNYPARYQPTARVSTAIEREAMISADELERLWRK